jgi:transcriptional regulator with XRE-family HTH domain
MLLAMATRSRPVDRARRRIDEDLHRVRVEVALARRGAGLSFEAVAAACGVVGSTAARIESGETRAPDLRLLAGIAATTGLELRLRAYPAGDPIRDAGQQRLLDRFRSRIHAKLRFRTEVPLPIDADRRAWDAVIDAERWSAAVDAETGLDDVQALERRLTLKQRDAGVERVILVIADTRRNRRALASAPSAFADWDRNTRRTLQVLRRGEDPGPRCLVLL